MKKNKRSVLILMAVFLLVGILIVALAVKDSSAPLSAEDAKKVVLSDLGVKEKDAGSIHVHPTTMDNKSCYLVYVSVDGENWEYTVDGISGEILKKTESDHGHSH